MLIKRFSSYTRTKIHCYLLDQSRVVGPLRNEKNYHIFYQMLAGLNEDERSRLFLDKNSISNFKYLMTGDTYQVKNNFLSSLNKILFFNFNF